MNKARILCEHKDYITISDGSSFRIVNHNEDDLMWRLTWAQDSITETDMLRLASMMDSYHYLMFECTQKRRNEVIKEIVGCIAEMGGAYDPENGTLCVD